ncbi:MAG: hypothetical protein ACTSU3_04375, partial [Candidatus Thorarchaeota archaeon]
VVIAGVIVIVLVLWGAFIVLNPMRTGMPPPPTYYSTPTTTEPAPVHFILFAGVAALFIIIISIIADRIHRKPR